MPRRSSRGTGRVGVRRFAELMRALCSGGWQPRVGLRCTAKDSIPGTKIRHLCVEEDEKEDEEKEEGGKKQGTKKERVRGAGKKRLHGRVNPQTEFPFHPLHIVSHTRAKTSHSWSPKSRGHATSKLSTPNMVYRSNN